MLLVTTVDKMSALLHIERVSATAGNLLLTLIIGDSL